jgi:hypothetical protein
MAWDKLPAGAAFVTLSQKPVASFFSKLTPALQQEWGRNSADMASILYQKPVMIAVHAKEMLDAL